MKMSFYHLAGCIFLFLLPAESSDGNTRQWTFSFPESIKVLKNADVTIPCTFTAPDNHSEVNLIWFKYGIINYPQIFNSKDPSQVITEYRGRTSLVNGTNSCTLRIKDVTKTEKIYPGISEEINSFHLNNKQTVEVKVTGCSEDNSCEKWNFNIPRNIYALKGSCVDIPCTFTHPEDAKDFNFFWYSGQNIIFNNKTPSDVADEYKGRTFLTGNSENNCSIRIANVENRDKYFPGINRDINSHKLQNTQVTVHIEGKPPSISITGTENMSDKKTINISCSVNHTCPSFPPTIKWSITGHPIQERIQERHTDRRVIGKWTMESIMTYTASYAEDKTDLECVATFPNNETSVIIITLDIKYSPKNVTISVDGYKNTPEEDDVTLICTSQANPPVHNYTWYQNVQDVKTFVRYGQTITVKNTTTEKYTCAVTNEMGTKESSWFNLNGKKSGRADNKIYIGIGIAVGVVFVFVPLVVFCIYRRKKKAILLNASNVEKIEKEEIPMDDHLYGNIDQKEKGVPRQSSSELEDPSHIYNNTDQEYATVNRIKENEQTADSDGVLYSLLELPAQRQELQRPMTPVETEYAVLEHSGP